MRVAVTPEVVRPRQTVTATVTTDGRVDKVSSATLEWGYDNLYRYHWAGRADSAAATGNDTLLTMGQAGTNYGGERDNVAGAVAQHGSHSTDGYTPRTRSTQRTPFANPVLS